MKLPSKKTTFLVLLECAVLWGLLETAGHFYIRSIEKSRPSGMDAENIMQFQEPLLDFGLKKGVAETMPGGWKVRTNRYGFRGEEFPVEKPVDEYRVFVVGGSTIFGWGVGEEESIPYYLSRGLKAPEGKRLRVINAGVPWYASWHEASMVFHRVMALNPDRVIVFNGLNDTAKSLAPDWTPMYLGYADLPTKLTYAKRGELASAEFSPLALVSLSPTLRYFFAKIKMRSQMETGVAHLEVWDQYLHYMRLLERMCSQRRVEFSVFLQPVMAVDKPLHPSEIDRNATSTTIPEFAETFRRVYVAGEEKLKGEPWFVSLRDTFKDTKELVYLDGLHYSAEGNRVLAARISKSLDKQDSQ